MMGLVDVIRVLVIMAIARTTCRIPTQYELAFIGDSRAVTPPSPTLKGDEPLVEVIEIVATRVRCGITSQANAAEEVLSTGAGLTHHGADDLIGQEVHHSGSVRQAYHRVFDCAYRGYVHYSHIVASHAHLSTMFRPHRFIRGHRVACDRSFRHGRPESLRHSRTTSGPSAAYRLRHGSNAPRRPACRVRS
jgi:hypothetical protein